MADTRQVRRIGLAGAVLALLAFPVVAEAQAGGPSAGCAGTWAASCASVEVSADGDRLFFYVPNAAPRSSAPAEGVGQRVRVYRERAGMACDPVTGHGCDDVTEEWSGPEDPAEDERCTARGDEESGSAAPAAEEEGAAESEATAEAAEAADCDAAAAGYGESGSESRRAERRRAGAVAFAVAIPTTAFLWLRHGGPETVVRSASEPGDGGDDGNGDTGNGGDGDGDTGNGDDGNGDTENGDTENGDTENGDTDNGDTGNGDNGNGDNGEGEGEGEDGGDGEAGDYGPWPGDDDRQPPMSEVPEPVSTTLVGLGLLGYAGTRIRRRLQDDEEADAIG